MAWKVSYRSSFLKNFKKLNKNIQNEIYDISDKIQAGQNADLLHFNWADFYSWHFGRNPEYRLIYTCYKCLIKEGKTFKCRFDDILHTDLELKNCDGLIEFILIDTREKFNKKYKMSKKEVKNYRRK